jgi:hypothetical protein
MSKHIFPHFYSLEAPVLWRPHRRKLALSRKHFRNAGYEIGYYTAGRGFNLPGLARLQASNQFFTDSRFNFSSATVDDADTYFQSCHCVVMFSIEPAGVGYLFLLLSLVIFLA